ncbi:hypothetical protein [Thermococcus sp. JCM 11816]|uniref:hypothetical protein n=1 Tax=Thermococcus sp. (strain JCM 11816 / KS-1) TaxID=1295125 RepID=UPI0006D1DE3F
MPRLQKAERGYHRDLRKKALVYYELEDNEKNRKLFSKLHEMTGVKGVPTTGVFYGGDELCAVVEGTFNVARAP